MNGSDRDNDDVNDWYSKFWLPLVESMKPVEPKWSEFIATFQAQFEPLPPSYLVRAEMRMLQQTGSLGMGTYITRFRHLSSSIPDMAEADHVDYFIRGLMPALQNKVKMSLPQNLITAVTIAVRQEATYQAMEKPRQKLKPNQS